MNKRESRVAAPTLATVAEAAGVSRQTVSNALNNPDLLSADTLAAVQAEIERLGYSPNRAARALRTRASHLFGLRVDRAQEGGASNAQMDRFLHSLVQASRRTDHHVLLFTGDQDDPVDGYDALLRQTAVDAFVVTDTYAGTPQSAFLKQRGAPFVAFGRPWDDPDADHAWVDVDGQHGGELATTHLIEGGHERIAWIGWEETSRIGEDRRAGWKSAMRAAGLATSGLVVRATDNLDHGRMAAHRLLDDTSVTAIACASDTLGVGVLHALAERDLTPGRDVGVVGFDDSLAAQVTWPGLTSVRQPLEEVAVALVRILTQVLSHQPIKQRELMLTPTLAVRRSSQRWEM